MDISKTGLQIIGFLLTVTIWSFLFCGVTWAEETAAEDAPKTEEMAKAEGEDRPAGDEPPTQPEGDKPAHQPGGAARKGEEGSEGGKETEWKEDLNWTIKTLDIVIACMGLLLVLIALIATGFGIYLNIRYKDLKKDVEDMKKAKEEQEKKWEQIIKKVKIDIKYFEETRKKVETWFDSMRKESEKILKDTPIEELTAKDKEKIEEISRRQDILELFGLPFKAEDYKTRGIDMFNKGSYEEAFLAFNKATEMKPDDSLAWYNKGVALGKLERHAEALSAFNEAIDLKRDYAYAWYNKGVALGKLGRHNEALAAYDEAIKLKPILAEAWNSKGVALGNLERDEEALSAIDKAIELDPDYANAWFNRACTRARMGDRDNALKDLGQAINLDEKWKEYAKTDEAFKSLWDDPDFKKLVE